VAAVTDFYM